MNPNLAHDKNPRHEPKDDEDGRDDEEDNGHDQDLGPAVVHFAVAPEGAMKLERSWKVTKELSRRGSGRGSIALFECEKTPSWWGHSV